MNRSFTDNTISAVSEEFNTIEKIKALENEAIGHPLEAEFNLAKDIIQGQLVTTKVIVAE